jgi:drug/metabolite transporter (DMT)-like permease
MTVRTLLEPRADATRSTRLRGVMLLLAGTATIAVMDALVKLMSASYGTMQLVWGRYVTQAILLFIVIAPRRSLRHLRTRQLPLHLFRVGALLCANVIFFAALRSMTLADANAIFFSSPLLITLLAAVMLGEAVGIRRWMAVATGFAGVVLVMRPGFGTLGWTTLLPLFAAVCSALYHITTPVLARHEDPANTLYFLALVAGIALSLVVPFYWTPLTGSGLLALLVIGTLGTIGHFLLIRAFQSTPAATLSPFLYVYLIWATVLGWLVFGDIPVWSTIVGALVIFAAGLYVYRQAGYAADAADAETH